MIFKFRPLLKPTLWGGDRIAAMKRLGEVPGIGETLLVAAECTDIRVEGHLSLLAVYVP